MSHSPQNTSTWAVLEASSKSLKTWQWEVERSGERHTEPRFFNCGSWPHEGCVSWAWVIIKILATRKGFWTCNNQTAFRTNTVVNMMFPSAPILSTSLQSSFCTHNIHSANEHHLKHISRFKTAICYQLLVLPLLLYKHNGVITQKTECYHSSAQKYQVSVALGYIV